MANPRLFYIGAIKTHSLEEIEMHRRWEAFNALKKVSKDL